MYNKKKILILVCLFFVVSVGITQSIKILNIDSCYIMAKQNYPLVKQYGLIEKSKEYSISNANKRNFPQFNIAGQATYQSEVTQLPISLPGISVEPLSNDHYRLYGEVSQSITDLFTIKDHKELIKTNSIIEEQKISVELYKIKDRINNLFFGVLLIDAQLQQTELLKKDIQTGIDKTNVAIENGIALKSSSDNLKVELLRANQRTIELQSNKQAFMSMLSLFIGQEIDPNAIFFKPSPQIILSTINRPELRLYDLQKKSFDVQNKLLSAKLLPQVSMFFQGGVGRPALNLLSNDLDAYYIGGLRLNWNLSSFYTHKTDKKMLNLNQTSLDIQRDVFLFNTKLSMMQINNEVSKILELTCCAVYRNTTF